MTMSDPGSTPDQELADCIADGLVEAGLVSSDRREELLGKIASGRMRPDDWRAYIEEALGARREDSDGAAD